MILDERDVVAKCRRAIGSRVRLYYRARVYRYRGAPYPVWGVNELGVDEFNSAHVVARVVDVTDTHVIVHPDDGRKIVAIHVNSMLDVTSMIITTSRIPAS